MICNRVAGPENRCLAAPLGGRGEYPSCLGILSPLQMKTDRAHSHAQSGEGTAGVDLQEAEAPDTVALSNEQTFVVVLKLVVLRVLGNT